MAELHEIRGIGPATAATLAERGIDSVEKLAAADLASVAQVPGFGPRRAEAVQAAANAALPAAAQGGPELEATEPAPPSKALIDKLPAKTGKQSKKKKSKKKKKSAKAPKKASKKASKKKAKKKAKLG